MTVIEVKENGAIRTKMLSCNSPLFNGLRTPDNPASHHSRGRRALIDTDRGP